jgi:hypothetical protein
VIRTLVKLNEVNRLCGCKPYRDHVAGCVHKNHKLPQILMNKSLDWDY